MKLAVISDIHENFHNLILAIQRIEKEKAGAIICLGDLINAGVAKVLAIQPVPVYMIWGNNDGEKTDIVRTAFRENSTLKVSLNVYDFLEIDTRKIFISHYNDLAEPMARSGDFDAVFYGHDHLAAVKEINGTLVVNPGELAAQKTGTASFALYDTKDNSVELIELEDTVSLKTELTDQYFRMHREALDFRSEQSFKL